jgi:hypothetical protein
MSTRNYFPASTRIAHALTGRIARRIYLTAFILLVVTTTVIRAHSLVLTIRIHRVIQGLEKVQIDETTEAELVSLVPQLVRSDKERQVRRSVEVDDVDTGTARFYYVSIGNDSSWMQFENFASRYSNVEYSKHGPPKSWIFTLADCFGYRYIGFGAMAVLLDGKVSSVQYGIAAELGFPRQAVVSVRSAHSLWAPRQTGFEVRSTQDENLQFEVEGNDEQLWVLFTPEASAESKSQAFQVNLSCFWTISSCRHAQQISPVLWQDKKASEEATLARLKSANPCPETLAINRVKYFPDVNVEVLESTGFKIESVNEEGVRVDEIRTNYKSIQILRGRPRPSMALESVRSRATVPYPGDYSRTLPNMGPRWTEPGQRVLAFSNMTFDSCRFMPALASTISAIQNVSPAARRVEDEFAVGLQ